MILKKKRIKEIIYSLFLLAFMLGRGSALSICGQNTLTYSIWLLIAVFAYLIISEKGKINLKYFKINRYPWIFIVLLLPSIIYNSESGDFTNNALILVLLAIAGIVTNETDKKSLLEYYLKIMLFFAVVSLIGYVLFVLIGLPIEMLPRLVKTQENAVVYRSIGIYGIWMSEFTRNCGPFWEPSIFAGYLILALIIRLFFLTERDKKTDIPILVITLITTMSSGGILLLLITAVIWIFHKRKYSTFWTVFSVVAVFVLTISWDWVCELLLTINYDLFSKIVDIGSSKSAMSRVYSVLTNIKIWKQHVLLGCGYTALNEMYTDVSKTLVAAIYEMIPSQSSTPFMFLAAYGIAGIYYWFLWFIAVKRTEQFSLVQKILFGVLIFFILNQTPHLTFLPTYYLLFTFTKKETINND